MTLFRGFADDLPLMEWLERHIWPVEKRMADEDVYWGTRLACVEMIRTGTTSFWDMYWHADAAARAVEDAGIRAVTAAPLIDDADPDKSERACDDAERSIERITAAGGRLARPGFAPHAIYSVSERSLRRLAERAPELGVPVQIHLSETEQEVEACVAERGVRPAQYLDACGLLGPDTILAHGVWLDDAELDLIAERGATVVTNPVANLKLAVGGPFPYRAARERGVAMGLGTDGPGIEQLARPRRRHEGVRAVAEERRRPIRPPSPRARRWRSRAASARRCSGGPRSMPERTPTSCSCARTRPSSAWEPSMPGWSMPPRVPWWTRPWSPVRC